MSIFCKATHYCMLWHKKYYKWKFVPFFVPPINLLFISTNGWKYWLRSFNCKIYFLQSVTQTSYFFLFFRKLRFLKFSFSISLRMWKYRNLTSLPALGAIVATIHKLCCSILTKHFLINLSHFCVCNKNKNMKMCWMLKFVYHLTPVIH